MRQSIFCHFVSIGAYNFDLVRQNFTQYLIQSFWDCWLSYYICRPFCGRLSLLECKIVCVWHWKLYFKWCAILRYLWHLSKSLEKSDNLQFKKTLFDSYVSRYMYINFICICHFQMSKNFFIFVKFCISPMCNCGAVVETVDLCSESEN